MKTTSKIRESKPESFIIDIEDSISTTTLSIKYNIDKLLLDYYLDLKKTVRKNLTSLIFVLITIILLVSIDVIGTISISKEENNIEGIIAWSITVYTSSAIIFAILFFTLVKILSKYISNRKILKEINSYSVISKDKKNYTIDENKLSELSDGQKNKILSILRKDNTTFEKVDEIKNKLISKLYNLINIEFTNKSVFILLEDTNTGEIETKELNVDEYHRNTQTKRNTISIVDSKVTLCEMYN